MFPKNVGVAEMNSTCVTGESLFVVCSFDYMSSGCVYTFWLDGFVYFCIHYLPGAMRSIPTHVISIPCSSSQSAMCNENRGIIFILTS